MSSQTLLPCPNPHCAAQTHPRIWTSGIDCMTQCNFSITCECGVSVAGRSRDEAIALWNSLPRALVWKNSPPKVPGWYWFKNPAGDIKMMHITSKPFGIASGVQKYAGPISEPYEPNEDGNK